MTPQSETLVDPGYRVMPVRLAGGRVSHRVSVRALLVTTALVVIAFGIGVVSLATGGLHGANPAGTGRDLR